MSKQLYVPYGANIEQGLDVKGGLTVDGQSIILPAGTPFIAQGANLTGAVSQTINPATDVAGQYTLPGALAQDSTLVLGVTGTPTDKEVVSIWVIGNGAHTLSITDDASSSLVLVAANTTKRLYNFSYDAASGHFKYLTWIPTA